MILYFLFLISACLFFLFGIIKSEGNSLLLPEGVFITKWIYNRMVCKNKNILVAVTGATGSGKSYLSMRVYELWCKRMGFKPSVIYICFSIGEVMKLLSNKDLPRYSLIVMEEAGTSLGNLDFQNRVSKLFTYILQSFRSMNIGLIMNLPVFTMLNKSARQLVHAHIITKQINFANKTCKVKCYFHQLNQATGKSYWKSPRVKMNGRVRKLAALNFNMPSDELVKEYETKKEKFVHDMARDFSDELDKLERDKMIKLSRKDLTPLQQEVMRMLLQGSSQREIARLKHVDPSAVCRIAKQIQKKGYSLENKESDVNKQV